MSEQWNPGRMLRLRRTAELVLAGKSRSYVASSEVLSSGFLDYVAEARAVLRLLVEEAHSYEGRITPATLERVKALMSDE